MSKTNPGKRFEAKFKDSLDRKGYALRIQDKVFMGQDGRLLSKEGEGDFWFFSKTGDVFLIECKATGVPRFPFDKLTQEQSLKDFDQVAHNTHSLVALNFYEGNGRTVSRCFLIPIGDYAEYKRTCGRKSMPLSAAAEVGTECPRIKGGIWDLPLF